MKLKLLSMILAVLVFLGSFSIVSLVPVSAADTDEEELEDRIAEHLTKKYVTPEAKLAAMTKKLDKNGYELWVLEETGEIAFVDKASGQITFSNPWNIASAEASEATKKELMSQIFIHYDNNGQDATFNSFEEAAQRGQILVKSIKNGVRIEYTIGREETRLLVPRYIKKSRFENKIAKPIFEGMIEDGIIDEEKLKYGNDYLKYVYRTGPSDTAAFYFNKFMAVYGFKNPDEEGISEQIKTTIYQTWPATQKIGAIFVVASDASTNELRQIELQIKKYCPDYTYEELDKDHVECQYEGTDVAPPLFKLALEYTIDDWGLIVTLPASGIRFNESLYKLDKVEVLPFMGAGTNPNSGYTFLPDGSGTLFDFEELNTSQKVTISGQMYGSDYAYHTLTATHQEVFRYPVFGIVEDYEYSRSEIAAGGGSTGSGDSSEDSATTTADDDTTETLPDKFTVSGGFVAIIEEGDSLASLTTFHGGATSPYNTVKMSFTPRPSDKYDLSGSLSVGSNSSNTWEVVSKRKYIGNYTVRYIMLTDQNIAKERNLENTYEPTWLGMAQAYSDYMVSKGVLEKLTVDDVKEDIPLYIETFGTFETLEKIMSIPVNVMTPLTTFEDIKTMYNELSAEGVSNINFKLTGFANGGLYSSIPADLKWEDSVGGSEGFTDLVNYAAEKGFGVFPDFDFVFVNGSTNTMFDSLNLKKHAVKTIDNRYTTKREYSATYQSYVSYYELAISPAYFMHFYTKFTENYKNYTTSGISVSTLGQYLNSDFDEDEPYNRADSQEYTVKLFEKIDSEYSKVMTDCGNAYTWKYVDYIINVPMTSSRYNKSSNAVPFMGVVLHGFVEFAGTPINMEGDISYAFLKAIESGSGIYFKLVYQNAEKLKDDDKLSQNYSVRYEIWKDNLVGLYTQLNDLLKDVQTSQITGHKFLTGYRVPDEDEILQDKLDKEEAEKAEAAAKEEADRMQLISDRLNGRTTALANIKLAQKNVNTIANYIVSETTGYYDKVMAELAKIPTAEANLARANEIFGLTGLLAKVKTEYNSLVSANAGADEIAAKKAELDAIQAEADALVSVDEAQKALDSIIAVIKSNINLMHNTYSGLFTNAYNAEKYLNLANLAAEYYTVANGFSEALEKDTTENAAAVKAIYDEIMTLLDTCYAKASELLEKTDKYLYEEGTPDSEKKTVITYKEYLENLKKEEESKKDEEVEETIPDRYLEDSGNIILLTYENGKTFILNYNSFDVKVTVDGVEYVVKKCGVDSETGEYTGYLVINEGGAK